MHLSCYFKKIDENPGGSQFPGRALSRFDNIFTNELKDRSMNCLFTIHPMLAASTLCIL